MCHIAREFAPSYFDGGRHVFSGFGLERECVCSCVTTLQGHLVTSHLEVLEQSSGMTLSRADLVLVW